MNHKNIGAIFTIGVLFSAIFIVMFASENAKAGAPGIGDQLVEAILVDNSTLVSNSVSYSDNDNDGDGQAKVCTSPMGLLEPTDGESFILLSTGIAGNVPVTTDGDGDGNPDEPGDERGSWFHRGKYGNPRDYAELEMELDVPANMYCLEYKVRFLSAEFPEYIGTKYNDKITIEVISPSRGTSEHSIDVNSADVQYWACEIPDTGFDIFAISGNPDMVDIVSRTPIVGADDAGASPLKIFTHPVSPCERITVTFRIEDQGDNMFDSAAFIDSLKFAEEAATEITARKDVQDLNGDLLLCNDTLRYTITIINAGNAPQNDNDGPEFEDFIPDNATYVSGSATAESGTISYDSGEDKITWDGSIPTLDSVGLTFDVTVDAGLENGTIISNQGTVHWDSAGDGTNDADELTDDSSYDDGIDSDGDNETSDDDPTNIVVIVFEPPEMLTEDFSDDDAGGTATQIYFGKTWFETNEEVLGDFEVVSGYYYSTANAFKTKLRSSSDPLYWNYTLTDLDGDLDWWEVQFACGNASEASDLCIDFKNEDDEDIAKIKFEYVHEGTQSLTNWVLKLYYWNPGVGWCSLNSDFPDGYLYNDWYKLRIEKNGINIDYSLDRDDVVVDFKTGSQLTSPFSNFDRVEWYSTTDPVACPMFFWDEHKIGLT